jgi:hypothetical protein
MEYAEDTKPGTSGAWDSLALIFFAEPRPGFEKEFRDAAARELSRLAALCRDEGYSGG